MATTMSGNEAAPRRRFLKGAGVTVAGAAAGAIAMPNVSRAQTAVLKMQGAWAGTDIFNDMAMDYVNRVNKMAGSRLKARISGRRGDREAVQHHGCGA